MVNLGLFTTNYSIQELVVGNSVMKFLGGILVLLWATFLSSSSSFKVSLVII